MDTPFFDEVTHAQFMAAAAGNDVATLRRYLEQGGDVDLVDAAGDSALVVATRAGHEEFVVKLLEASPRFGPDLSGSALEIALQHGRAQLAAHLYRAAFVRAPNVPRHALLRAVDGDDPQVVRRYLSQLDVQRDASGELQEPFFKAFALGRPAIARLLLATGADPLLIDSKSNSTAMVQAALRGDTRMIGLLLDAPAANVPSLLHPKYLDPRSAAVPLVAAAGRHHRAAVAQLLKARRASRETLGAALVSALHPLQAGDDPAAGSDTVQLLLQRMNPSDLAAVNAEVGGSVLHFAARINAWWSIDALVAHGVPVDVPGPPNDYGGAGTTPFLLACVCGAVASMKRLAALGADIGKKNDYGVGAMTLAVLALCKNGTMLPPLPDAFACLLDLGCDPDAPEPDGQTPRSRAADLPELVQVMAAHAARTAMLNALGQASPKQVSTPE